MSHKFDGTWSYYNIAERGFPPNGPTRGGDFNLAIDDSGRIDPRLSTVDGRAVQSGRATGRTIEIVAADGRDYRGHLVREAVVSGQLVFTIAGRFRDPSALQSDVKTSKKSAKPAVQNEGTWVITKP